MAFQKAVKAKAKGRVSLAGPSGSGKTYTALQIATGLSEKVAVLDTEHGSASKYADIFNFDVMEVEAPFHPNKFVSAIDEAAKAGYGVLVIDSLSHAWNGKGGLLEIVGDIEKRMKSSNSFAAWKDATPIQQAMIEAMLSAPIHIIATMRSKQEYILEQTERGGRTYNVPKKVGMAPVQRDGMEYEFDVFAEIDLDHNLVISKTRCPALDGVVLTKDGAKFAEIFGAWLTGADPITVPKAPMPEPETKAKPKPAELPEPKASSYVGNINQYPLPEVLQKNGHKTVGDLNTTERASTYAWAQKKNIYPELRFAIEFYGAEHGSNADPETPGGMFDQGEAGAK
jgi:hypothetical protein